MLSFGVTVLPDPPYTRMIELMQLAEQQGSSTPGPTTRTSSGRSRYATLAARRRADEQDQVGPLRHQSGDPGPDDHRELVRDDAGHLRTAGW